MNCSFFIKYLTILSVMVLFSISTQSQSLSQQRLETHDIQDTWNPLPPVDFTTISSDLITDYLIDRHVGQGVEQDINYYIGHFHRLANAVRTANPSKGFIDIVVWRNAVDNQPYNARIMENITTLAWFYTQEASWNPYYGHPDLRKILEASLRFWVSIQNTDGRFSEYGVNAWNLAATAFATKFMGRTLEMLSSGPPIDAQLYEQVRLANRKALMVVFTNQSLYTSGIRFSNQYGNAFTGALAYLDLYPNDTELRQAFLSRLETSLNDFQSPAGYFYEQFGPDWGYAFGTHHSNILMAWHYARHDQEIADHYALEHSRYAEWLSYNAVQQPGDQFFVLHSSIETRQRRTALVRLETPLSEVVPLARAFNATQEDVEQRLPAIRQRVTSNWTSYPALQVGNFMGYSAYAFHHRDHYRWNPTEAERQEAVQMLPYLASDNFIHQRIDNRTDFETSFIRKASYYAAFSAGTQQTAQQRFGLGLLWNPTAGALLQSQSASSDAAWGTQTISNRVVLPWEASPVPAVYKVDGVAVDRVPGTGNLDGNVLEITYPLGSNGIFAGIGEKKLTFSDEVIRVEISHNGPFKEILPLVVVNTPELIIDTERGVIQIFQLGRFGYEKMRIEFDNPSAISAIESMGARSIGNGLNVIPVHVSAEGALAYTITLTPQEPLSTDGRGSLLMDMPNQIRLVGNYPNPFNPTTNIVFELDSTGDVQLEAYDMMGRRVFAQNARLYQPGRHTLLFDASSLASGTYMISLIVAGIAASKSVTLLK
jgi:hypothetical protein